MIQTFEELLVKLQPWVLKWGAAPGASLDHLNVGSATGATTGQIDIPMTTASVGIVKMAGDRFLHAYGTTSLLLGLNAGNLTNTGARNIGIGGSALVALTTGYDNLAIGLSALDACADGQGNVAIGRDALGSLVSGTNNTAVGLLALSAATGSNNVAVGSQCLMKNTTGYENTAVGLAAMYENLGGASNSAFGDEALKKNTSGIQNVALGMYALYQNTTGHYNTAVGFSSMSDGSTVHTGTYSTALGYKAGEGDYTSTGCLYLGALAGKAGAGGSSDGLSKAVAIGYNAQVTASNVMALGGTGADAIKVAIGATATSYLLQINSAAAPDYSQFAITANSTGMLSALTFGPDNVALGFDVDYYNTGWVARDTSAALLHKEGDALGFYANAGLTSGNGYTPILSAQMYLVNGFWGFGRTNPERTVHAEVGDGNTNTVAYPMRLSHICTTAATGMANGGGVGIEFELETATDGTNQLAATDDVLWVDATNASRKGRRVFTVYDTAAREAIRMEGSGSAAMLGFFGVNAVVKPTALTTQLTAITHTAPGTPDYAMQDFTQTSPWGFASHDEANSLLAVIANLQTRLAELETRQQALGLLT